MELRTMTKDVKTSLLGFGCMRFPTNEDGSINETETMAMFDEAYNAGVNYFDTAYPYHGGESERVTGRALARYPRESYYLATKLPMWSVKAAEDVERIFNEQLEKLQKDYIDFYLLHALSRDRWKTVKELKVLETLEKLKAQGKIRHIGFSFHDNYAAFEEILKAYPWEFCQIQFNYMDRDSQATTKGVELAKERGVSLVIMEPVKGGLLATLPAEVMDIFEQVKPGASAASWALRYAASFDAVKVVLSGMSSMEQMKDNLGTFADFAPLSDTEKEAVEKVAATLHARVKNGCTGCRYCMPCPAGVNIPGCFSVWNRYHVFENKADAARSWGKHMPAEAKPAKCVKCGKCEEACPQKLSIREDLAALQEELDALL